MVNLAIFESQKIVTEAVTAVVNWGFEEIGLQKIFARVDVTNIAFSWRVMEKIGILMQRSRFISGRPARSMTPRLCSNLLWVRYTKTSQADVCDGRESSTDRSSSASQPWCAQRITRLSPINGILRYEWKRQIALVQK